MVSINIQATEVIEIKNSECNHYFSKNYGLAVSRICIDNNEAYFCKENKIPYGSKIPNEFYSTMKIDKARLKESITKTCISISPLSGEGHGIAQDCTLSDHELFKPIVNIGGIINPHSCFCNQKQATRISLCVQNEGKWHSTAEFEPKAIKDKLSSICLERKSLHHKIACFCKKHFDSDNEKYMMCLKKHTESKIPNLMAPKKKIIGVK